MLLSALGPATPLCEIQKSTQIYNYAPKSSGPSVIFIHKNTSQNIVGKQSNNCTSKNTQYSHFLTMKRLKRKRVRGYNKHSVVPGTDTSVFVTSRKEPFNHGFVELLKKRAKKSVKTIVLPETEDMRTIEATDKILKEGVAKIILIGNEEEINKKAAEGGIDISGANIVDPETSDRTQAYIDKFVELRAKRE